MHWVSSLLANDLCSLCTTVFYEIKRSIKCLPSSLVKGQWGPLENFFGPRLSWDHRRQTVPHQRCIGKGRPKALNIAGATMTVMTKIGWSTWWMREETEEFWGKCNWSEQCFLMCLVVSMSSLKLGSRICPKWSSILIKTEKDSFYNKGQIWVHPKYQIIFLEWAVLLRTPSW